MKEGGRWREGGGGEERRRRREGEREKEGEGERGWERHRRRVIGRLGVGAAAQLLGC